MENNTISLSLLDVKGDVLNLNLVRLDCLILACLDEKPFRKVDLAKEYYEWVMNGKVPNDNMLIKSNS